MTRRTAKQILAMGTLLGFLGVSGCLLYGFGGEKADLVFGAWIGLITKIVSDYFGDSERDHAEKPDGPTT